MGPGGVSAPTRSSPIVPSEDRTALVLGDIATVKRGYADPPEQYMRFNNQPVLGIGITMRPSGPGSIV